MYAIQIWDERNHVICVVNIFFVSRRAYVIKAKVRQRI